MHKVWRCLYIIVYQMCIRDRVISCSKYEDDLVVDETMSQKSAQGDFEMQLMSTSSTVINIAPSSGYTSNSSVTIPAHKGMSAAVGGVCLLYTSRCV